MRGETKPIEIILGIFIRAPMGTYGSPAERASTPPLISFLEVRP